MRQDGKISAERARLVKQMQKALGLLGGPMTWYSKRHLEDKHRSLFNNRELESLNIQYATLIVTGLNLANFP